MLEKKSLTMPKWVEALLAVVLVGMAVVEFRHNEFFWATLFGVFGIMCIVTMFGRKAGETRDGE